MCCIIQRSGCSFQCIIFLLVMYDSMFCFSCLMSYTSACCGIHCFGCFDHIIYYYNCHVMYALPNNVLRLFWMSVISYNIMAVRVIYIYVTVLFVSYTSMFRVNIFCGCLFMLCTPVCRIIQHAISSVCVK